MAKNQLLQSITYDPAVYGYDDSFFKTLVGTPSVSSSQLRFNSASAASYWCFRYGALRTKITFPVAPVAGQDKKIGFMIVGTGEGAYFDITGAVFSAKSTGASGSTTTTVITWNAGWTAVATTFEIVWTKDYVQFLINGTIYATHKVESSQNVPSNPAQLRILNGNADNEDITYLQVQNAESIFNPANKVNVEATIDAGDIEIGAVELKDADTDNRSNIKAANTARTTATIVVATQPINARGEVIGNPTTMQALGSDATGADAYATVLTPTANAKHISIVNTGVFPAIISLDAGATDQIFVPGQYSMILDEVAITNAVAIQAKNGTAGSNYTGLYISIW